MSEQISDRAGLPNLIDRVKQLIPVKFRRDAAVVPVVRLSGVIGAMTPLMLPSEKQDRCRRAPGRVARYRAAM